MIGRIVLVAASLALLPVLAVSQETAAPQAEAPASPRLSMPVPDAERGHRLFVTKGCVICHRINGVGGKAGPALDAPDGVNAIAPLDFAARMWRGAAAMAVLQSMEIGYIVQLNGDEIADLAAFAASRDEQAKLSEIDIPEVMRGVTVDEPLPPLETAPEGEKEN